MSLIYSNSKNHILDPINFQEKSRMEFRLSPNRMYLSGLKLVNFGFTVQGAAAYPYVRQNGLLAVIKSIQLYDGNVLLDEVRNISSYTSFKNLLGGNDQLESYNEVLSNSRAAVRYNVSAKEYEYVNDAARSSGNDHTMIDLTEILPMLSNTDYLPTMMFKNLRLIVEFYDSSANLNQPLKRVFKCQLSCDEIEDENAIKKIMGKMKAIEYNAIEHELVLIPGVTTGQIQTFNHSFKSLKDKYVNKILITKTVGNYKNISFFQLDKIQFALNGKNMFPYEGITNDAMKQKYLNNSWGHITVPPNGYTLYADNNKKTLDKIKADRGAYDYVGFNVLDRVEDLQLQYQRLGSNVAVKGNDLFTGLELNVFGEVRKLVSFNDGKYRVSYI